MARAAAAAAMLNRELDNLNHESTLSTTSTHAISTNMRDMSSSANKAESSINQLSGRLGIMLKLAGVLGPALSPIGAVGIAGVAGMANQLAAVAVAGGTAIIAFQGVGDTLKAVNKAALEPTAENIEAARLALANLSPAAADVVMRLQELRPVMIGLRDVAAEGLMPGVLDSIDSLEARLPDVERILEAVSHATGNIIADAGEGLAGSSFDDFFDFLASDVPVTLHAVAESAGSLAHGLAELWMAFDPLNDDFSNWLVGAAADFDSFASGLSQTQGFTEFIAYVRDVGPQVAETAGALASAFIQIAEAAAPIGGPVLAGVEALAKAIGSIADSNLGTPIMAAVAAMSLLSLGTKAYGGIAATSFGQAATSTLKGVPALREWGTTLAFAGQSADNASKKTLAARDSVRGFVRGIAPAAAAMGAVALASSGAADGMGLTNTATLALMGTMAGPFGAAAGAAVGFTLDMVGAAKDAAAAYDGVNQSIEGLDFVAAAAGMKDANAQTDELLASIDRGNAEGWFSFENMGDQWTSIKDAISGVGDAARQAQTDSQYAFTTMTTNANVLADALTKGDDGNPRLLDMTMTELTAFAQNVAPAAAAAGLDLAEILGTNLSPDMGKLEAAVRSYTREMDSVPGRTGAFTDALAAMDDDMLTTAQSAAQLSAALEGLLNPQMNLSQATDAFQGALRTLDDSLAEGTKSLKGFGEGAVQNRAAVRGLAGNLQDLITAQAEAGAGPEQLARTLKNGVADIVKFGHQAGLSAKEVRAFAAQLGLTPKLVRTVLQTVGLDKARTEITQLRGDILRLPKQVRTKLEQEGYALSRKQVMDLKAKYDLTPKQVRTLLEARDNASKLIKAVQADADKLDHTNPDPNITAHDAASRTIEAVRQHLAALDGNSAQTFITNTISTIHREIHVSSQAGGSGGGGIRGAEGMVLDFYGRGGIRENHVAQIAPAGTWRVWAEPETGGEAYIPLANDHRRPRAEEIWREAGKRIGMAWMEFAQGGLLERPLARSVPTPGPTTSVAHSRALNFHGDIYTVDARAFMREAEQRERDAGILLGTAS